MEMDISNWDDTLQQRWAAWQEDVMRPLRLLYGERADFEQWVARSLQVVEEQWAARSAELRALDEQRLLTPDWFLQPNHVGYIAYTDRFAGNLNAVADKIAYLKELGITYLHLMPLLKPADGENDGGYAVADYRQVDPRLGTIDELEQLAGVLRQNEISLCIDLVCNHTATDHEWAIKAKAGNTTYQDYYLMFPDRTIPDQYDPTLREIFPEFKRGNFMYHADIDKWVWTTFNPFQWDLNYANPAVFVEMLDIILDLANRGVEIFRMDAVAFMWKQIGTSCENLPQAHALLQAWRALTRIAAPATLLEAEAIVAPEDVVPYFGVGEATGKECELAYHNSLMVLLWSALAEQKVNLLTHSLQTLPQIPTSASWVNYVRCHDDIGWAVTDENARGVGLGGFEHRKFLSDFYSGEFPGTFARGLVFQFNPENFDRRINGSCASLAGLEIALEQNDVRLTQLAIGRILLIHSMILAYGGIPLIYMGDELGMLNDYGYTNEPEHAPDSRWVHRPEMDWTEADLRNDPQTLQSRIFSQLAHLIHLRKNASALHAQAETTPVWLHNDHVFGLLRHSPRGRILAVGNFSQSQQHVPAYRLVELGFDTRLIDLVAGLYFNGAHGLWLEPYQSMWLEARVD